MSEQFDLYILQSLITIHKVGTDQKKIHKVEGANCKRNIFVTNRYTHTKDLSLNSFTFQVTIWIGCSLNL